MVESTEEEAEMPTEDIQKPVAGDLKCEVCDIIYKSTLEMRHHIKKFHKNVYLFKCDMCGKGFMSKESKKKCMKRHMVMVIRRRLHMQGGIARNVRKGSHGLSHTRSI